MGLKSWLAKVENDRYCSCGRERAVDAVKVMNRKTGIVDHYIWGIACPIIDFSFHTDASAQGNGHWNNGHQATFGASVPSWLTPEVLAFIKDGASDFGYCNSNLAGWEERILENQRNEEARQRWLESHQEEERLK
jgi:hypothetical protein